MNAKLKPLDRWLSDQSWELGTDYSKQTFNKRVKLILISDPQYTISPKDIEDYIVAQHINHSDPEKVAALAKVAAIQFGSIQAFCKDNELSLKE